MSRFCKFDLELLDLSSKWRNLVDAPGDWKLLEPVGRGEAGSWHIYSTDLDIKGFAKPALAPNSGVPRGAHEKIASDLASFLGLPVPPVALWKNPLNDDLFSISLNAFRQPLTFAQSELMRTPSFMKNAAEQIAAGCVFHSWIADQDHRGHPENILVDANGDEETPGLAFIDHAFSLSYDQNQFDAPCSAVQPYYLPYQDLPKDTYSDVIEMVLKLDVKMIEEIVSRIPGNFSSSIDVKLMSQGLDRRRQQLSVAFNL
jgi:hypothetical protein